MTRSPPATALNTSIDPDEVARFSALAGQWWDPNGAFRPLHKFNPARLGYIHSQVCGHFGRDGTGSMPFLGLRVLDIGCGGGLVSEPMARLGADVLGADASAQNIGAASAHASAQGLPIDYRQTSAEQLAQQNESFEVILNLEVIEHVLNPALFIADCARLLRPGGLMIIATLNRTLKSYALAVIGAEYVLGWVPRGTHDWSKFITPVEMRALLVKARLEVTGATGVSYHPLSGRWSLNSDLEVNYMMSAAMPAQSGP